MKKVLIVFGSKSDESIYQGITQVLKEREDIHFEVRICSAHRTPDELESILETTDAEVIIAGAGLAAHLPGVVASKTTKPIIGVPVAGNYKGLDALLSIMQMPPGIPVMSVGVDKSIVAANQAKMMLDGLDKINLIGDKESPVLKKATKVLDEFEISYTIGDMALNDSINIKFTPLDEPAEPIDDLIIYVPLLSKDDDSAEAALNILKNSTDGLWVGLNRGENAALAATEILAIVKHELKDKIKEHREKGAEKVRNHDKELQGE